jgi:hypothetical protein
MNLWSVVVLGSLTLPLAAADNLALNRPVKVSSTDWAPTPAEFAVDGESDTGWRAADGDNQWIEVDLQGDCQISAFRLISEATRDAKPYTGSRLDTLGNELFSSCATSYTLQASSDDTNWTDVYSTTDGKGGTEDIALAQPVIAHYVRLQIDKRSSSAPVGLNEFEAFGTCAQDRPKAEGWTTRRVPKCTTTPDLTVAPDGTVPVLTGWDLTCQNWLGAQDGTTLSQPGIDTHSWYDATVPGTIMGTLIDQGVFPDPAYGLANLKIPEALCRRVWWYRREFKVPAGFHAEAGRMLWLELDGVHYEAEVWFNGQKIGDLNAFTRGRYDITKLLQPGGPNVLALKMIPMPFPGSPGDKGADGKSWVNSLRLAMDEPTFMCATGWDWMPAIRDRATGILDAVRLRSTGPVLVGDLQVETRLPQETDTHLANVTLTVPVSNAGTQDQQVTVTATMTPDQAGVSPDPAPLSQEVTVPAGASTDVAFTPDRFPSLALHNPQLWWPNGYGAPNLHHVRIVATTASGLSDSRSVRIGLRDLRARAAGITSATGSASNDTVIDFPAVSARFVRIDCRTRLTKFGYSLWNFSVYDSSKPTEDLALHQSVTASSSDNGHGPEMACDGDATTRWSSQYSDSQWIAVDLGDMKTVDRVSLRWEAAAAKTYVVQVSPDGESWTDVKSMDDSNSLPAQLQISVNGLRIFCRGGNWGYDELSHRGGLARMETAVRMQRDSHYTMVRNWTGAITRPEFYEACDENGILVFNDFWVTTYGFHNLDDPENRHSIFLDAARDTILRYRHNPSIAFWCGCNEGSPPQAINDGLRALVAKDDGGRIYLSDSASGPVEGHGPYSWTDPKGYRGGGFHSEIGIPTVPVTESMQRLAGDQPAWPIGPVWNYHDWCPAGGQSSDGYRNALEARLGKATDLDDFCTKAQFINYESMRAIYESYNHTLWNQSSAVLIWMSHPAWMSTTWQTYDYDFEVNGSFFGAQKACEPVHVQAMLSDWAVDAINQTAAPIAGATVTATSYDLSGKQLGDTQTNRVDLPASTAVPVFTAAWPDNAPPLHLLRLELRDAAGKLLSDNTYWRYQKAEDMQSLNSISPTTLSVDAGARADGSQTVVTAKITNSGSTVAPMVTLSLRRAGDDARVLPVFPSDGNFWLLPNESRTVTLECATSDLKGAAPEVRVSAYHVAPTTVAATSP